MIHDQEKIEIGQANLTDNNFFKVLSKASKSRPEISSHRTNRSEGADKSDSKRNSRRATRRGTRQGTPLGTQFQKSIQQQVSRDLAQLHKDQKKMMRTQERLQKLEARHLYQGKQKAKV